MSVGTEGGGRDGHGAGSGGNGAAPATDAVDLTAVFTALPGIDLVLAPDAPRYTMLAATDARLRATMTTREGTIGRPLFEVFPDANPENAEADGVGNLRASLDAVLRTRAPHRMPVQRYDLQRPDGTWEERHWAPLNVPVLGPDGAVRYVVHRVEDVTEALRLAAERDAATAANARLRGEAAERELANLRLQEQAVRLEAQGAALAAAYAQLQDQQAELETTNQQLQESAVEFEAQAEELHATAAQLEERTEAAEAARAEAEAANRAKSEFLAVMSHELRTPLNAIGGYAELIELGVHGPVTPEQRTALARIQASQRHLLGLIAGVLDYSRVEAGAVVYRLADVPVGEVVAEAEALVAPQLRAKGLGYAWSGAPPALRVRADREKLQQILLNLLGNAVKFTSARDGVAGRIEVACTVDDGGDGRAARGRVRLHVRDTGDGIAADVLERVFEPFVQADQRLTRPYAGVGLGLAISRDLARGMGGELTVESVPAVGSTFTLTLPRA